ncbi:hypothetical protein D9C73_000907 [Collichthys lucidus]|uniref:Uncharacterized protein n=1 Tax=Collichthys lucidus TaxID=240159 RepID=A0A4U5U1J6_COLLU|nr:hypothetical protein D9C73_000907 [Collichthys lucidus]
MQCIHEPKKDKKCISMSEDTHHNSTFYHNRHPQGIVDACIILAGEGEKAQNNTAEVMAVRRLKEEEMILCREMHRHWTALKARALELGMISSDSSLVGMSEDAKKGLHCLFLKKQTELKAEMVKVKDYYERILSHQPLLETDEDF